MPDGAGSSATPGLIRLFGQASPPVATSVTGYPFRLKETALGGGTARGVEIRELAQGFSTLAVLPPEENGQNNRS